MPRPSPYLPRLLIAAEQTCSASDIARALVLTLDRATLLLRYWERNGLIEREKVVVRKPRHLNLSRNVIARYRLTDKGRTALDRQRADEARTGPDLADVWRRVSHLHEATT